MAKINPRPEVKDMIQAEVTAAMTAEFKKAYEASKPYETNVWTLSTVFTLKQFTDKINPDYSKVTGAYIIAKKRNDNGKIFYKMAVTFGDEHIVEWELSYEKSRTNFEEGDEIDPTTLLFCLEICGEKTHLFATGELL